MRCIALFLASTACALTVGCKTQANPEALGEGGWIRDTCRPYEALNAEHGVQSFWIEKVDDATYKVTIKPAGITNIPQPYPGSKLLDTTNLVVSEERVYSIPEGRTFVDVWEYYDEWFHFGRAARPDPTR